MYFVSAPHGTRGREAAGESGSRPVGEQHARKPGSPYTACGRVALDWRMFWELPFPVASAATCRHCMISCGLTDQHVVPAELVGGSR
ncbi:hypothetical protein [Nocardioides cavernaquae]|uniref:Uncharacterized protein n=1 Tax=Nocardioides cavernaquae TaxID=2321396 RepID=A0A3A5H9P7_9ACTN|nr:hypothetical protein [Nocardioides cavernaquae]RJS46751.1 hypothetical protein D4739_11345 [Nocardioides cavernaquae]